MSVHPDKTAIRAVDACGGTYSAAEMASRFAEGHSAALCEAMKAVVDADALTANLLGALCEARDFIDRFSDVRDGDDGKPKPNAAMQMVAFLDAEIQRAEGAGA
jgi:hypothetical protein